MTEMRWTDGDLSPGFANLGRPSPMMCQPALVLMLRGQDEAGQSHLLNDRCAHTCTCLCFRWGQGIGSADLLSRSNPLLSCAPSRILLVLLKLGVRVSLSNILKHFVSIRRPCVTDFTKSIRFLRRIGTFGDHGRLTFLGKELPTRACLLVGQASSLPFLFFIVS